LHHDHIGGHHLIQDLGHIILLNALASIGLTGAASRTEIDLFVPHGYLFRLIACFIGPLQELVT
jgi:hypothetical protein